MIDYGCGSGILAVAAAVLGAASVEAVDKDPQALLATTENATRNGVERLIGVHGPEDSLPPADLLLSNILAAPLAALARRFAAALRPGGRIVLSGILAGQADDVARAYSPWFVMAQSTERDGWIRMSGERKGTD